MPAQSEAVLAGLYLTTAHSAALLVAVATAGNVLGAVVNWLLGRYLMQFQDRKWFPVKKEMIVKVTALYQKWGIWSLLFAWVPFIGDPLTLVAGMLKANIWIFLCLVTVGKAARYVAIILLASQAT